MGIMAGQTHEQRSTETCSNEWYRSDAKESAVEYAGVRNKGGQKKHYKDTLKQTLKLTGINAETWHELAKDRTA